jgi:RNA polymerase sigma factor (sigma-70 family)
MPISVFEGINFDSTLAAARRGDASAIEVLLKRSYPAVQRAVHHSLATEARRSRPWLVSLFSTGDIVQEVCSSVLRDVQSFEGVTPASFVTYLSTLVRNRLVDSIRFHQAMRRNARRTTRLPSATGTSSDLSSVSPEFVDPAAQPPLRAARAEDVQRLCRVLADTPERERALLTERLEHHAQFAAIAEQLGYSSPDAARKAFYAAQARLVLRLRLAGVDPGASE